MEHGLMAWALESLDQAGAAGMFELHPNWHARMMGRGVAFSMMLCAPFAARRWVVGSSGDWYFIR